jgi:ribonuclease T2
MIFARLLRGLFSVLVVLGYYGVSEAKDSFAILALSWQPAFCEYRQNPPECASQSAARYDASHFSLHGLWPGPRNRSYCGIPGSTIKLDKSGRWGRLPELHLNSSLMSKLNQIMPGTRSFLQRHEWVKHGSCHENGSANGYYSDSLLLVNELNNSPVQQLFSANLGKFLKVESIQAAFNKAFGMGSGQRIRLKCRKDGGRLLISELTIGLYGEFDEDSSLSKLIMSANPTGSGCKGGIVDRAGLQ